MSPAARLRDAWRQHAATTERGIDARDFSIVLGGPLYQLLRRAHMSGDALQHVRRRIAVIALFAWLPLLLLTFLRGDALGGAVAVPFVKDVEVHVRFLVAMPLLIAAELIVHMRMRLVAGEFVQRGLVGADTIERFRASLRGAMRLRNSVLAELVMIVAVYTIGVPFIWRQLTALDVATWYASGGAGGGGLTPAGVWYAYVSVPVFQFLLLRWYFRLVVWMVFLWRVSRIRLNLSAMHADRMAGLGFLANTVYAFIPLAMAHGALVAGTVANRIFFMGAHLKDSAVEIAVVVGVLALLVLGPLTVFAPQIADAKRTAGRIYGRLAQRYVTEFEDKWLPAGVPSGSALGSGDIQSLADLANSVSTIGDTRLAPITRQAVMTLVIATLAPIAPLLLTVIPAAELAQRLLKMIL